jgi:hypothetical protein
MRCDECNVVITPTHNNRWCDFCNGKFCSWECLNKHFARFTLEEVKVHGHHDRTDVGARH